jgi:hypothetical protein
MQTCTYWFFRVAAVGTAIPGHHGERMHTTTINATALEKLKTLAKQRRNSTGQTLTVSLESVAQEAGYLSWKQVTMLAGAHTSPLGSAFPRMHRCHTVEELCEVLGGIEPVLLRERCEESQIGARCLCELDPFITAKRANVAIDIGDKYDMWNYLYQLDKPFSAVNIINVRINLGLGSHGHYLNEHLLDSSNDNRSNSLNPNNDANHFGQNNRSDQLNPNNERFSQ